MLREQCLRTPDRIALRFGEKSVTYAELDACSNRIAHILRGRGVRNGGLVGVCLDRGPDMVAAMIGVLKAGAGYVPLDPGYPAARLHFIAEDAGLALIIAEGELATPMDFPRQRLLLLDDDRLEIDAASADAPRQEEAADPESVAYAIYTSGSTGQPKGVRIPHRAVLNFLGSMRREPGLGESDRLLAVTTTSFDIAVLELFLPLSVGAEVILASREQAADGHALAVLLSAERRDGHAGHAFDVADADRGRVAWRATVAVLVGGEPLAPELAAQLCAGCAEVWNMYGPTETTVWSTCCKVARPETGITIGRPIANTTVWVRDARGPALPGGRARRDLDRRRWRRVGLSPAAGVGCRTLRARPVFVQARRAPVSHRRSWPLACGRHAGTPGAPGFPGQGARQPHRVGRDRSACVGRSRGGERRGCRA
jgi:amino acid adenylation domain-containing protein